MHFIERLFAIAPDGGNGSLEMLLLVGFGIGLTFAVRRWRDIAGGLRRVLERALTTDSIAEKSGVLVSRRS